MQKLIIALIGAICFHLPLSASAFTGSLITTVVGTTQGFSGDGAAATLAELDVPGGVAVDAAGNLFIADSTNHRIRKVDSTTGMISTVAGTGAQGSTGDGDVATAAQLSSPFDVTVDAAGNLFIADAGNNRIRKVDSTTGVISTVAGTTQGFSGDGNAATTAQLDAPTGVAVDTAGNLFIADQNNNRIRKVNSMTGMISTVAGTGTSGSTGDGDIATTADLRNPTGVAVDADGNLFIADAGNNRIRAVESTTGIIDTVAGMGMDGFSGDGGASTAAQLDFPTGVAVDVAGNLLIADSDNNRIRKVNRTTGIISTVAGTGTSGLSGDGAAATAAQLDFPVRVVVDAAGNLFIVDAGNHRIRKIEAPEPGDIHTVAGTGVSGFSGDEVAATAADLNSPFGVAVDAAGNLFIADGNNHRIRKVDGVTGVITTVAGSGTFGFSGDSGQATVAQLYSPFGVAVDAAGNLFIADQSNHRIRKVDGMTGVITTVAGSGTSGSTGDGGQATVADLNFPTGVAVDAAGNLFIADRNNRRIRKVDGVTGVITTVAGTGTFGFSGDGGAATAADLSSPSSVVVDAAGNLFTADEFNNRIRKVDGVTGVITTVAGTGSFGFSGDGAAATAADLAFPRGVTVDATGNLFIADQGNKRIRKVDGVTGVITTVAGTGTDGFSGDGAAATAAAFANPFGVAVDVAGNLFIADYLNHRIRKVEAPAPTGTGKIGDFVWEDSNGNGRQDAGEPGIEGVMVKLWLDCNSATTQSMTTSNGGAFLFDGLPAGQYQLEFVLPNGYTFSPRIAAGDYTIDSNPDAAGLDTCKPLGDGEQRPGLDAGLIPSGGPMDTLMVIKAIYYPNDNRIWIKAVSDALPASAIITATAITNGVETELGQVGWKAGKNAYQQAFNNLASVPDTIRLNSHLGGMVTSAVQGGGSSSADTLAVIKAVYYTSDNRLWIKASSDALPAGSAVITASTVTSGVVSVAGQLVWKPSKNAYQQVIMNIVQPDSVILNSNLGGTVAASVEVRVNTE